MTERRRISRKSGLAWLVAVYRQVHLLATSISPLLRAAAGTSRGQGCLLCFRGLCRADVKASSRVYLGLQELVKREDVAVIDCCTRITFIFPWCRLESRQTCYCEKP